MLGENYEGRYQPSFENCYSDGARKYWKFELSLYLSGVTALDLNPALRMGLEELLTLSHE